VVVECRKGWRERGRDNKEKIVRRRKKERAPRVVEEEALLSPPRSLARAKATVKTHLGALGRLQGLAGLVSLAGFDLVDLFWSKEVGRWKREVGGWLVR